MWPVYGWATPVVEVRNHTCKAKCLSYLCACLNKHVELMDFLELAGCALHGIPYGCILSPWHEHSFSPQRLTVFA